VKAPPTQAQEPETGENGNGVKTNHERFCEADIVDERMVDAVRQL
jgi:hypothetical protein